MGRGGVGGPDGITPDAWHMAAPLVGASSVSLRRQMGRLAVAADSVAKTQALHRGASRAHSWQHSAAVVAFGA